MAAGDRTLDVVVVAGDPLARAGITALLASSTIISAVAELASLRALEESASTLGDDALAWEPGFSRSPAFGELEELPVRAALVVVLVVDDADAFDAWRAGARGVLSRGASRDAMIGAIVAAASGLSVFEPDLTPMP